MEAFLAWAAAFFGNPLTLLVIGISVTVLILLYHGYRSVKLRALEQVTYDRAISTDGFFAGETVDLTETVRNPGWLPLFRVKLEFYVPAGTVLDGIEIREYTRMTSVFNIPPFAVVTKKHTLQSEKRGHYILHPASITYFRCEFSFDESQIEYYVYPSLYGVQAQAETPLYRAGNALASRKYIEDPFFLAGIREYRAGDPLRSVNFKASVRAYSGGMRRLMTNDYDSSRTHDAMIFLDLNQYGENPMNDREILETGLQYACYLFCQAVDNDCRVGFCANCSAGEDKYVHIPCQSGDGHHKAILRQFAELDIYARRDFSMHVILERFGLDTPPEVDLYLITSHTDDRMAELLHLLSRDGRNVQVVPLEEGGAS